MLNEYAFTYEVADFAFTSFKCYDKWAANIETKLDKYWDKKWNAMTEYWDSVTEETIDDDLYNKLKAENDEAEEMLHKYYELIEALDKAREIVDKLSESELFDQILEEEA